MRELALSALHTEHAGAVLGFVHRYVDDRQQAEDVVQETFLRVWRHIDSVDVRHNPRAYLFTTARNVLTDQWRHRNRRPRLVSDNAALAEIPTADDVDAALDGWVIAEALQRLSTDHQAVVQALFFDGLSIAAAGDRLGIAPGTVKSRSYYAVRALRAAFEELGVMR